MDVEGPIPPELWTLQHLTNLTLGINYLTGSLSPAIGDLTRLQYMNIGTNALSGPIPKQIGLLTDLTYFDISSNNFSGSIPPEIGNCMKLQYMFIHSSGLTGTIPSSFANLVELQEVWIMDLELTGPIPDFIGYWTKLDTLRIVGSGLSGPIPSSFSNFTYLTELWLSDISNVSSSLEFINNMRSLSILVLRNNNLTGTIPSNFGEYSSLQQLDLSFNKLHGPIPDSLFNLNQLTDLFLGNNMLTGTLPNITSQSSLQNIDVSYNDLSGSLPSWVSSEPGLKLNVVANNFTLEGLNDRILPGLNCLQKNFPCHRDKDISFNFSINCGGLAINSSTGTLFASEDTDLGPASFFVKHDQKWAASNGRLVEKDFDVRRTAGDSFRAVKREYKTNVSQNHLEVHLFWAGKGTCCIPNEGTYGPLISAISAQPDSMPPVGNRPPPKENYKTKTIVGVITGVVLLSIFAAVVMLIIRKRRKPYTDDEEILNMEVKPYTFTYSELKSATQNFDPSNKLGEGGFGSVYKGNLIDEREITVKQLSSGSRHGKGQFIVEIVAISSVLHRNLVKLYGCCFEGDHRLLVYEYLPNGSLDKALFGEFGCILELGRLRKVWCYQAMDKVEQRHEEEGMTHSDA